MINIDYSLILVILNFIILLVILNKILYKPITKFLEERKGKIAADLDDAEESKKKAKELVQQKENELKTSADEIRLRLKKTRHEANSQANEIVKTAKDQERKILKETEMQIKHEQEKAFGNLTKEMAELISNLSGKFLSKKVDEKSDMELIDKILKSGNK